MTEFINHMQHKAEHR